MFLLLSCKNERKESFRHWPQPRVEEAMLSLSWSSSLLQESPARASGTKFLVYGKLLSQHPVAVLLRECWSYILRLYHSIFGTAVLFLLFEDTFWQHAMENSVGERFGRPGHLLGCSISVRRETEQSKRSRVAYNTESRHCVMLRIHSHWAVRKREKSDEFSVSGRIRRVHNYIWFIDSCNIWKHFRVLLASISPFKIDV